MILTKYYVWLVGVSLLVFVLERLFTWRKGQRVLRPGIGQDLFWLGFNGHFLGLALATGTGHLVQALNTVLHDAGLPAPESLALMRNAPLWLQATVFFVLKDFLEWNIHRLLHRTPWLWEFHKLHHSIEEMDWIGNFRFHWGEIVVYKALTYLPLVILGVDWRVMLGIAVFGTLMQDLNHANIRVDWGPLRYLFNSPMMHVWHHDVELHGKGGQNFGIVLSVWDWVSGTVYWPKNVDQPRRIGFAGMDRYPRGLILRLAYPFYRTLPFLRSGQRRQG